MRNKYTDPTSKALSLFIQVLALLNCPSQSTSNYKDVLLGVLFVTKFLF